MSIDRELTRLGLTLPAPAKPAGSYKPCIIADNTAYISGQGPLLDDGTFAKGVVGKDLDLVAFEGTNYLEFNTPRSNAYHSSLEAAGQQLCKLLLRRIEGESAEKLQMLQEPEFMNRQGN